jgi:eukaryotic-like serine/threonine-protein kinase
VHGGARVAYLRLMESSPAGSLHPGQVFAGRYRIVRALKEGGMGVVYEVRHVETDALLALKVMLPDKEANAALRERFRLEWRLTANILGDHVVRAFDAGFDEDTRRPFLVMERLSGEDLGTRLARDGALAPAEVATLSAQLARALARIHAAGVVHRDIRPANLFLSRRDDGSPLLKVLDFGIAKVVLETTRTIDPTLVVGSPPYMPPEQLDGDGDIGTAADLYAFAHVAFALLVGSAYWEDEYRREGLRGLRRQIEQGLPEPASVRAQRRGASLPPAFDAWFQEATLVDPDDRPASPAELAGGLARVLGVTPSPPQLSLVTSVAGARARALPMRLGGAALVALAAAALLAFRASGVAPRAPASTGAPLPNPPDPPGAAGSPSPAAAPASAPAPDPAAPPAPVPASSAPYRGPARPLRALPRLPPAPAASASADPQPDLWGKGVQ